MQWHKVGNKEEERDRGKGKKKKKHKRKRKRWGLGGWRPMGAVEQC
jgi:hypothetical protein